MQRLWTSCVSPLILIALALAMGNYWLKLHHILFVLHKNVSFLQWLSFNNDCIIHILITQFVSDFTLCRHTWIQVGLYLKPPISWNDIIASCQFIPLPLYLALYAELLSQRVILDSGIFWFSDLSNAMGTTSVQEIYTHKKLWSCFGFVMSVRLWFRTGYSSSTSYVRSKNVWQFQSTSAHDPF